MSSHISTKHLLTASSIQDFPDSPIIRAENRRVRSWLSTNIPVQWGKHTESIAHDDDGVALSFKDGTTTRGDIVFGVAGIDSIGK